MSKILATALASLLLVVVSARDAAANCQNGSDVQSISAGTSGDTLVDIMAASTSPCTLNIAPGTYVASPGRSYTIADGITVRGTEGAGATVLWVTPPQFTAMTIAPVNGSCPSGATLEGLTIAGGAWGILALADASHPGCPFNQLSNITLRNLIVVTGPGNGHAIDLHAVQNSVIDTCYVDSAYANGIILQFGSNNNIVMNNTIVGSFSQHAIAVQSSNDNVIVGNTISVSTAFDGIILNSGVGLSGPGSLRNRIERNTISGHKVDGIVLTDSSHSNYVGLNVAVSDAYTPGIHPPSRVAGAGIWVNNASNANYLFGNDLSGSPENGIDVLASNSTLLVANTVHGNYHGGVWVAYALAVASPSAPVPQDTVLHGNNLFFNYSRQLFFQNTINSQAAFNYFSGAQSGVLASTGTVGFDVQDTASATMFENTISEVWARAIVHGSTSNAVAFRNRFLKGTNNPGPSDGLNGLTYSLVPADVRWDAWSFLGGNHWSEFGAATGNPDLSHPYTGFITNSAPVDRFPFASETLQTAAIPNSITVVEPAAGAALAAQTRKTIRWVGRGCSYVESFLWLRRHRPDAHRGQISEHRVLHLERAACRVSLRLLRPGGVHRLQREFARRGRQQRHLHDRLERAGPHESGPRFARNEWRYFAGGVEDKCRCHRRERVREGRLRPRNPGCLQRHRQKLHRYHSSGVGFELQRSHRPNSGFREHLPPGLGRWPLHGEGGLARIPHEPLQHHTSRSVRFGCCSGWAQPVPTLSISI